MRKLPKPSPTASPLLFELNPEPLKETLTALGGIPLVVQAFRSPGLPQSIQEHVRVKQLQRGYDDATFVESFVILNAAGGEWVEDFERLRQDPGLAEMIGHGLPSPRAALEFLQAFHQEEKIAEARQQRLPEQIAYIPKETPTLEGLGRVNRDLVRRFGERVPDQRMATVDQDATIIESHKQQALSTYKAARLIEWHREKAGTIEFVHDVIKNQLGGGVQPSKYFGANTAWLRSAVIAHNVLGALKRLALPPELLTARPKRLRFLIFNTPGRLVHHARNLLLRLASAVQWTAAYGEGLRLLPLSP